jgi:hypothetical protein
MAVANHIIPLTGLVAASDLSSKQYYLMGMDSSGNVTPCISGDPGFIGILLNKPASGEACELAAPGSICPVSMDAAVAVGSLLICSGDGQAAVATDGTYTVGLLLEASTAASQACRCITWFPNSIADVSAYSTITI